MDRRPSATVARAGLALLAIGAVLAPIFVLRALPHVELSAVGLGWVPTALAGGLAVGAGLATIATLASGLRHGSLASLALAGASAALVGGSLAMVATSASMAASVVVAAGFVLGASVSQQPVTLVSGRRARVVFACLALVVAEAAALAQLVSPVAALIAPYDALLLAPAAVVAMVAAVSVAGRYLGSAAAALTIGATALALARGDGVELVVGLIALIGASLMIARSVIGIGRPAASDSDEAMPALAMLLSEGVLRFDGHLRLRSWNPAAATLLGLDDASNGTRLDDLLGVSLAQLPAGSETVLRATPVGGLDLSIHRDGSAITVVVHEPGTSGDADRLGRELRGTIEELLQARRTVELQRAEIERATSTDPLTGVASRSAILDRLRIEVAEARRYQHPFAVVIVDIDRFGEINTAHGIDGGDALLREVALRVRLRVRAADALGRSDSDALLAILPHTDEGGAATFADALRRRVGGRPLGVGDAEVRLTISIGVAVMRAGEDLDVDGLMARAEEALASARGAGGDRIALDRLHGLARLEAKEPMEAPEVPDEPSADEGA